jgi:aspartate kinase
MRIVMKFGGTSVGDGARIQTVAEILRANTDRHQVVAAVSAVSGVTDALIRGAKCAAAGEEAFGEIHRALFEQHRAAIGTTVKTHEAQAHLIASTQTMLAGFENLCRSILVLGELTPRALDAVASLGERLVVPIVVQCCRERGLEAEALEASELIVTDDGFTAATPEMNTTREKTRARLLPLLNAGRVPIVTGFIGATRAGIITTLGRGGSDYTATILGSALDADEVWIWTDVDGVMTADPRIVPEAQTIAEISYGEAAELSYFGAKVIHPKTILPASERNIPVRILNTFNPAHPGTRIVREPKTNGRTVKAITAIRQLSLITVEGRGMQGVPGVASRVFAAVAREGINVLMISQSSSEQNICFIVQAAETPRALTALEREFELERLRRNIERVWAQDRIVIIAVVGAGMKGTRGIAAKVFGALAEKDINVISIAQGSSEYNLSVVVDEQDADEGVRAIHRSFNLQSRQSTVDNHRWFLC